MTDNRATDLLRKLLDEHGVEWLNSDGDCCDSDDDYMLTEQDSRKTTWSVDIAGDDMTITAHEVYENDELQPWFELEFHEYFTPEQAIAATLGGDFVHEEIVRCRDCKWFHWDDSGRWCAQSLVRRSDPDGFCAWGERRGA